MTGPLADHVQSILGPCTVEPVPTHPRRQVARVIDGTGRTWYAKRPATRMSWRLEVRAYRRWVPAFSDQAPRLHSADEASRLIIVDAVPADPLGDRSPDLHRRAGALLRRVHGSRRPRPRDRPVGEWFVGWMTTRLRGAADLLGREEVAFLRLQIAALADTPPQECVPCHGDFQPRNWLFDAEADLLRVIDFGGARWQVPVLDLTNLCLGAWWREPEVCASFLDGYGRALTQAEVELLGASLSVAAMNAVRRGTDNANARLHARGRQCLADLMSGAEHFRSIVSV